VGWKAFIAFATDEPGYFGSIPEHDAQRAEQLRIRLGLDGFEPAGERKLDAAIYPRGDVLYLGAYPRGVIVCHTMLPGHFFDEKSRRKICDTSSSFKDFKSRFLGLYPNGEVLVLVLHSVVNLWGYCVYAKGSMVRSVAGAADDGLIVSTGAPLSEEARILESCPIEKVDENVLGEELVFDVSTRMLGKRIDEYDELPLLLTEYKPRSGGVASLWRQISGQR
jgi:hypothetical protein